MGMIISNLRSDNTNIQQTDEQLDLANLFLTDQFIGKKVDNSKSF